MQAKLYFYILKVKCTLHLKHDANYCMRECKKPKCLPEFLRSNLFQLEQLGAYKFNFPKVI